MTTKTHHLAKPELQTKILNMLRAGKTQADIADRLGLAQGTVTYHVARLREAGRWKQEAKEYLRPRPVIRGKRICATCGKPKTLGAFPSPRNATCTMCFKKRKLERDGDK